MLGVSKSTANMIQGFIHAANQKAHLQIQHAKCTITILPVSLLVLLLSHLLIVLVVLRASRNSGDPNLQVLFTSGAKNDTMEPTLGYLDFYGQDICTYPNVWNSNYLFPTLQACFKSFGRLGYLHWWVFARNESS